MNKVYFLVLTFLFTFGSVFTETRPQNIIQNVLSAVNTDSLFYFIKELSGYVPTVIGGQSYTIQSRHKNQPGNDKAQEYIQQKLNSYGLTTSLNTFSATGKNVIGVKLGTVYPNKKYIICAHFDDMPSGLTAPGSDDNASGTAAVIEAARILKDYTFPYTIIFALWDEEEQGLVGSNYYATQASSAGDSIRGVFNMDMIAWDSNSDSKADIHTRSVGTSLTLSAKIIELNTSYNIGLNIITKNPGITASDHASFWTRNYGAILLIEESNDFNAYYHTINDNVANINTTMLTKCAKAVYAGFVYFANDGIIPVELASFTASYNGTVKVAWTTSTETNNKGFYVERKSDNQNDWRTLDFVVGAGTSTSLNSYLYEDKDVITGKYFYRLKQIDFDGTVRIFEPVEVDIHRSINFALQNYPNPFNPSTKISYTLPNNSDVSIVVYDLLGNEISHLVNGYQSAGSHIVEFNGKDLPSGTYIYLLKAGGISEARRMLLIK